LQVVDNRLEDLRGWAERHAADQVGFAHGCCP
jgi:hypothetical protein